MSLTEWLNKGWLKLHHSSPREIADLRGVIERDLRDARTVDISADARLTIAYNAALQCATAALAASCS
jgi:hypothetical protein